MIADAPCALHLRHMGHIVSVIVLFIAQTTRYDTCVASRPWD